MDKNELQTPVVLNQNGQPLSIEKAMEKIKLSAHGAIGDVEGAVWRVERHGKVEFLCKYVRYDKVDGKFLPENNNGVVTWNVVGNANA